MSPEEIDGVMWFPFSVEFDSATGKFEIYIYATSHEHAEEMLDALKVTGRIAGQVVGYIEAGEEADALMSADRVLN